jgi:hypothetical protein
MTDFRAHSLVVSRIKYNWLALVPLVFYVSTMAICSPDAKSSIFVFGGTLVIVYGGLRSYRELLAEGEAYHVFSGLRLTKNSSFAVVVFCIAFELAIVGFLYVFAIARALNTC